CGAVTRKVVCLVWTLGDDARGRLIHDLDAVLLQDREDELPIVARHLPRFAEAQLVDPELNTGLDGVHDEHGRERLQSRGHMRSLLALTTSLINTRLPVNG